MVDTPTFAERIATRLKDRWEIYSVTGDRVLDHDYRAEGWNSAPVEVMDHNKIMLPTLAVDDQGGDVSGLTRFKGGTEDRVYVWVFSSRSRKGHREVEHLSNQVWNWLQDWQDPVTKMMLRRTGRAGVITAEDGSLDCVRFKAVGIRPT